MPPESSAPAGPGSRRPGSPPPRARASARPRPRLRELGASPIPRVGAAGPSVAQVSPPPTQLRNSTGRRPPEARGERHGSGIAHVLRVRAAPRTVTHGRARGSRPRPARPPCDARRRRSEIFREGGGTHGSHNYCDRAARRGGARWGRLGILAVAPVVLAAERSAPAAINPRPVDGGERRGPPGEARDPRLPARALAEPGVVGGAVVGDR